jgi:hypothetical protein
MDQRSIVLYLRIKGMQLDAIHSDLVATLDTDAVASLTVAKYAGSASFVPKKDGPPNEPTNVEPDLVGHAILAALAEHPFSSVRELSVDLPSSINYAPAPDSLAWLQATTFTMSPPLFDSRAEANASQYIPRALTAPVDPEIPPMALHRDVGRAVDLLV